MGFHDTGSGEGYTFTPHQPVAPPEPAPDPSTLSRVRKEMALKYHPDVSGGSHDAMKAVNVTIDRLDELRED